MALTTHLKPVIPNSLLTKFVPFLIIVLIS